MAMFLLELMMSLFAIFVCLGLIAACGYVIIQSWLYIKKTFNIQSRRKR